MEPDEKTDALIADVVDAVGTVRRVLGVGLLESLYRQAMVIELTKRGHSVQEDVAVEAWYDGVRLKGGYSIDLLVDDLVVELKATAEIHPTAYAQTLTYIRVTGTHIGLLVNFHSVPLRNGIHRLMVRRDH